MDSAAETGLGIARPGGDVPPKFILWALGVMAAAIFVLTGIMFQMSGNIGELRAGQRALRDDFAVLRADQRALRDDVTEIRAMLIELRADLRRTNG